jgi:hypothetical protein
MTDAIPVSRRPRPVMRTFAGVSRPTTFQELCSDLALLSTVGCIVSLFVVSSLLLEKFGIPYATAGGGIFSKVHPATVAAIIALGFRCLATGAPFATAWRLFSGDRGIVLFLSAVVIGFLAAVIAKVPFSPFVDSFVLAVFVFILLRDLDPAITRWIALAIALVLVINNAMAIWEFLRGMHVVTIDVPEGISADPTRGDVVFDWRAELAHDWRATALLGHPLVNGMIVGCLIICMAAPGSGWLPELVRVPILLFSLVSMFAFGARTSLVLSGALAAWLILGRMAHAIASGRKLEARRSLAILLIGASVVGLALALYGTGFFDHTIERFQSDAGSASTRRTMFDLFQPLSWTDIMLGPDAETVATWQRIDGLEFGIESSWVGLVLSYGVIVTSILAIGMLAFARSVSRACGAGVVCVLLFYFISISVTASLSGKTTTMAMVVALVMLFLRADRARRPAPARAGQV